MVAERPSQPGAIRPTVLVVDDEQYVRDALARSLSEDYRVLTASAVDEALAVMSEETVDVIITDEVMPGPPGTELLRQLAVEYPEVVRIMLTGHASLDSALRAINEGRVFRYVQKPWSHGELMAVLREAIGERSGLPPDPALSGLSTREREVLVMVSRGVRVKDVAASLNLSPHTVRNHLKSLFRKLGAHSQAELVRRYGRTA
jgi:DNA-binding NarL/FixJ family response regulator